ncbi:Bug family tripartite tricarboxylate transporter substrate binding protein [Hydrogenophaga sp. PBL-H3]|uniref:Bug family tripartite tricarboxylate transporter substrate binding protein n=1 Tax=Hydrogenophaga sp. PBL-H3 TaxID=434010 RepID=UPI00131FD8C3|nr:tripartite tricarboxylate transporter substrate binding protein [Hydrogenophaga sp. PBL-H3]QHE77444.1 tripartite tricarboxylate transporter substrate binding protein [Hydrogenophaga sp. PBL-H3]QHE81868.1 tripartite tricarboxylate transporter substrate binding protein [Hydrogenophaga sp. PBL-H3]
MQRRHLMQAGAALAVTPWFSALAETYPDRPIKMLQGFAPGGNADNIARVIGIEIGKTLGQPIVVEAQSGAGGTLAAGSVARAKPDGYTLLLATGGHAVAGALYNTLPYRTVQDFDAVSTITFFPFLVVTTAESKYKSFSDVLTAARAAPGSVAYGTAGIGSTHHLAGELLAKMAGVQMLHVPYRGDSASLTALLSGDVPFIIAPPTAVLSNIKGGKLRALAATGPQRWPGLPDVPSAAEQGVAGYDVRSWAGVLAPAGLPKPVLDRLNAEINKALLLPSVKARLEEMGGEARGSTPEEMKTMVANETQRWTQVVADAKIPKQ